MTPTFDTMPQSQSDYRAFLHRKTQLGGEYGFEPVWMPDFLFGFQRHLIEWALRKGRAAIFADCGLGKTPMSLVWGENVVRHANRPLLYLTPLGVTAQTVREAEKFGIEAHVSRDGSVKKNITVTNYERLHLFNPDDFGGAICDEFSCCKAMDGKRRAEVTEFLRSMKYRLLGTATAAPNDYIEIGTASEALGEMGQHDMISMFFRQETKKDYLGWGRTKYRMMPHAEKSFWRFICSWARACRRPSDLGFSDDGFILPDLTETEYVVSARTKRPGFLIDMPAMDMREEQEERRRTITERCEKVAELVANVNGPSVAWCHLNPEGDLLLKLIPGSKQIKGSQSIEEKEELYEAFSSGQISKLVIKPRCGCYGLNWQHCWHTVTFASHSYEQDYQLVRRFWRFGQKNTVRVDRVVTEGEQRASINLQRKKDSADKMFSELVANMNDSLKPERIEHNRLEEVPSWL